ncbi:MAG TPA: energy transducer TonB [Gammaproteobacteria bacterium]|nr:energy transducer TonB [Gammaproteobacteria bacterium]
MTVSTRPTLHRTMELRFPLFLGISLLAHGGLMAWRHQPPPVLHIGGETRALQVSLASLQAPPRRPETLPTGDATPPPAVVTERPANHPPVASQRRTHRVQRKTVHAPPEHTPAPVPRSRRANSRRTPASPSRPQNSSVHLSDRISAALRRQLASQFEYPWLARKRGWQGRVMLSLRVEGNGTLTHWKILQTSGHGLLDRSALRSARRIGRLPEAAEWLHGRSLDLKLPVSFRLLDG